MKDIVSIAGTMRVALRSGTLANLATNTTVNGIDHNLGPYDGCMFYISPGTWTDGTHTFTVQEAADNGSGAPGAYTTVAPADLVTWQATSPTVFTPVKATDANGIASGHAQPLAISSAATALYQRVGYVGGKQWVRISVTSTGVTAGASYEVLSLLGRPDFAPAAL